MFKVLANPVLEALVAALVALAETAVSVDIQVLAHMAETAHIAEHLALLVTAAATAVLEVVVMVAAAVVASPVVVLVLAMVMVATAQVAEAQMARFVSFGPEQAATSHQQVQETFNA